jgi:hypothetical protein
MKTKIIVLSVFISIVCLIACTKKSDVQTFDCTGITPTYTANIKSIIDANCATSGCHNASSQADGIDLSTFALVKSHTGHNAFLGSIQHVSGYEAMPKGGSKLSDADVKLISCWVQSGAPQ